MLFVYIYVRRFYSNQNGKEKFMINLKILPDKRLELIKLGEIYYGENNIGSIIVEGPQSIGSFNRDELNFTLNVIFGGEYIRYGLEFDENGIAEVPITQDITDHTGVHRLFVEISAENNVIGRTEIKSFTVSEINRGDVEVPERSELVEEIERLRDLADYRLSALNAVKAAILAKGVEVTDSTPATALAGLISLIPSTELVRQLIERTPVSVAVPYGTEKVAKYAFYEDALLTEVTLPQTVTRIEESAFTRAASLISVNMPENLTYIGSYAFQNCSSLESIIIPGGVGTIGSDTFKNCRSLSYVELQHGVRRLNSYCFAYCQSAIRTLYIPNTITGISDGVFFGSLSYDADVTLENGFNASGLDLSAVDATATQITTWFNALADRSETSPATFIIGVDNIAKLTNEQIAIAVNKNWSII